MNRETLQELVKTQMPFGKYKGVSVVDLPLFYLEWFSRKGFPKGKLGTQLAAVYEIKFNGLGHILEEIKKL